MTTVEMLSDERSPLAERLSVAARSWVGPDALTARDPTTELELLFDAMNELNRRRICIERLEHVADAARTLLSATIADAGEDDTDDGCVALNSDGSESAVTFKMIRELKAALAKL